MAKSRMLLEAHLKALRLPTFLREYEKLARRCAAEDLDCRDFLQQLCELELLDRDQRATERRIKAAKFPVTKSLDTFDFLALPSVNKKLVLELARGEFIDRRENVLALGNSGTGKTHIALALGLAACQRGYRTRFTSAAALVNELLEARDERQLLRFQKQLAKQDLLIIDELGFVLAHRLVLGRGSEGAHALGVVEPGLGHAIIDGFPALTLGPHCMILHVAPQAGLAHNEFRMRGSPVFLEGLGRQARAPLEKCDEFHHGLATLRAIKF